MSDLDAVVKSLASASDQSVAWRGIFEQTWPYVLTIAIRSLSNQHDAEDVAQSVYLKLITRWSAGKLRIVNATSLRALLAVTTRRLAADYLRTQHRMRRDIDRQIVSTDLIDSIEQNSGARKEALDGLMEVVDSRLNEHEQRVLELRLQGYRVPEIAKRLAFSTRTIERNISQIKELLQLLLEIE